MKSECSGLMAMALLQCHAMIMILLYLYQVIIESVTTVDAVTISPPKTASVCRGHQLEILCTTPGSFLEWSFFLVPDGQTVARIFSRILHSESTTSDLEVNSIIFTFSRISAEGSLPVMSRLLIAPANEELNGTLVNCTDVLASETKSTSVLIVNEEPIFGGPQVMITVASESLKSDNIRVTLEWVYENYNHSVYSYNVSVSPVIAMTSSERLIELIAAYNTLYTVNVVILSQCGQRIVTTSIELHYTSVNCLNPSRLVDESINVIGFREPGTIGDNVILICTSGLTLIGPNASTCMGNGEWEPDPGEVECVTTNTTLHMTESALSKEGKIAVASSVTVFTVASILFFIIGFLCGHFCQMKRKSSTTAATSSSEIAPPMTTGGQTQIPYYDDVVLQQPTRPSETDLELKENVAYSPIR